MDKRYKKYYNEHQTGGSYENNNRKNNFFVSIPRRNLDGHINRRADSNYKHYLFQRSKYKNRNRRYNNNNYLDRSYCNNNNNNYKRKRFFFNRDKIGGGNNNQDTNSSVNIKKEPNSMDDDKLSCDSKKSIGKNLLYELKREPTVTKTTTMMTTRSRNRNGNSSEVTDDDKTEENLEIDTTRSGASSKTVENLNTPLKSKRLLIKGIDEMSEDEKITNWLEKTQANTDSLNNNFSSISSYEDVVSPKRKYDDFESGYSDNDSENAQNPKKSKIVPSSLSSETNNNNSNSNNNTSNSTVDKNEIHKLLFGEELLEEGECSPKDDEVSKTSKTSHNSPSNTSSNNPKSSVSSGKISASGKKYDIRNHKSIKRMQELQSSISKFSHKIKQNPPSKTTVADKSREHSREKRQPSETKRMNRSISLIEPKSPHHDRHRRSKSKKSSVDRDSRSKSSRRSSTTSDREAKRKYSTEKNQIFSVTHNENEYLSSSNVPVVEEIRREYFNDDELLNVLESTTSDKATSLDEGIIDITNDNDDIILIKNENDGILIKAEKCPKMSNKAADDQIIEVIDIDRDEKIINVSNDSLEIEIIDMTMEVQSPKVEKVENVVKPEVSEEVPAISEDEKSEISLNNKLDKTMNGSTDLKISEDTAMNCNNNLRNSSVIVDSRAISTPDKNHTRTPPVPESAEIETTDETDLVENAKVLDKPVEDTLVVTGPVIRVRDPTSMGEDISAEENQLSTIFNSTVISELIDGFYLYCGWHTNLRNCIPLSKVLENEVCRKFNNQLLQVYYKELYKSILTVTYEIFENSVPNYLRYTDPLKVMLFGKIYEKINAMCLATNVIMPPQSDRWIESLLGKCVDKYKDKIRLLDQPQLPSDLMIQPVASQLQVQQQTTQHPTLRQIISPNVAQPTGPVKTAVQAPCHSIAPRQNVIETNKSSTNTVQSLKDIRIGNYHPTVSSGINSTGPMQAHQNSVPETINHRPVELINHLVNNSPTTRPPGHHNKNSPQQTASNNQYGSPGSYQVRPSNPNVAYIPPGNDQRYDGRYLPIGSRFMAPPPYGVYGQTYDPNQYSHIHQQQYLNYQNHLRANHQQKQTTVQVPTTQPSVQNPSYSSILRSSLVSTQLQQQLQQPSQPPPIQPKPNTLHYPSNSYVQSSHGSLQPHGQQSSPQYQRPQHPMANPSNASHVRNHLRNHIEMSNQQAQQQTQPQTQQQAQAHQQQQQQQPQNLQKKISQPQSPQGSQRPVVAYEIVRNPTSDSQYQLRLTNDLTTQIQQQLQHHHHQQQSGPPSNQVTSSQERISPDSQTTRDAMGVGGGTAGDNNFTVMVKSLVRDTLREIFPQMQHTSISEIEMTNRISNSIQDSNKLKRKPSTKRPAQKNRAKPQNSETLAFSKQAIEQHILEQLSYQSLVQKNQSLLQNQSFAQNSLSGAQNQSVGYNQTLPQKTFSSVGQSNLSEPYNNLSQVIDNQITNQLVGHQQSVAQNSQSATIDHQK